MEIVKAFYKARFIIRRLATLLCAAHSIMSPRVIIIGSKCAGDAAPIFFVITAPFDVDRSAREQWSSI